jgi:hypothetical protein
MRHAVLLLGEFRAPKLFMPMRRIALSRQRGADRTLLLPLHHLSGVQRAALCRRDSFSGVGDRLARRERRHVQALPSAALIRSGLCPACGGPVVEVMTLGPLKMCAFTPSQNFERTSELPEPSVHIFYHRRVADVIDSLPKVTGYWASQITVSRMIFGSAFRLNRRWPA